MGWRMHFVPDSLYRRSFPSKADRESGRSVGRWELDLGDRGFPDLVLVRGDELLYRELKVGRNRLTEEQEIWRDRLLAAGADWGEWRDKDYDDVIKLLNDDRVQQP